MGVCPSWKPPTSFVPLRSLAAGVATSSITAVDPYPLMCAVLALVLATALILSSVRNYFKHAEEKKRKKSARESKQSRDKNAAPWIPKDLQSNGNRSSYAANGKPKPLEPVAKSSGVFDTSRLASQAPKTPDTTVQSSTEPAVKIPPSPPPKPVICPSAPTAVPQIPTSCSEISSVYQVTTSRASKEVLAFQEPKSFCGTSLVPDTLAKSQTPSEAATPVLPKLPEADTIRIPVVTAFSSKAHETIERNFNTPDSHVAKTSATSPFSYPTKSVENKILEPLYSPTMESQPDLVNPTILATLESELDAFRSSWAPENAKQAERRQEVSLETTSGGQQYRSLTSETMSWSSGPQHEVGSFVQAEEIRKSEDGAFRKVTTSKSDSKQEDVRMVSTEFSSSSALAQQQLGPPVVDLSWRPSSPIFNQPLRPPGEPFPPGEHFEYLSRDSPTPSPQFDVYKTQSKQVEPVAPVWSPPSTRSAVSPDQQPKQEVKRRVRTPPRPYRKNRRVQPRLGSAPPRNREIWDPYSDTELVCWNSSPRTGEYSNLSKRTSASSKAISDSEDWYNLNSSDDEMGSTSLYTRRKKMYSSSSFYEEPHSIYPTVEEQVELARKIAGSLSNDTNLRSRGASMFFKRVKRANSWVHEGPDPYSDGGLTDTDVDPTSPDTGTGPYIKVSTGPPKLKLILDPRQLQDLATLRSSGLNPVDHAAVSPDICLDLVRDMNSPKGKGAALFAKRKQKAEDWVVDEEKVKQQIAQKEAEIAQLREESYLPLVPGTGPGGLLNQNRLKMLKSPWEAALESPYGSCDSAFVELPPVVSSVASSIIRAAEKKVRLASAAQPYSEQPSSPQANVYRANAPRGWMGPVTGSAPSAIRNPSPPPQSRETASTPIRATRVSSGPRPYSFHDFNTLARTWSSSPNTQQRNFRHVDAPSVEKSKSFGHKFSC